MVAGDWGRRARRVVRQEVAARPGKPTTRRHYGPRTSTRTNTGSNSGRCRRNGLNTRGKCVRNTCGHPRFWGPAAACGGVWRHCRWRGLTHFPEGTKPHGHNQGNWVQVHTGSRVKVKVKGRHTPGANNNPSPSQAGTPWKTSTPQSKQYNPHRGTKRSQ